MDLYGLKNCDSCKKALKALEAAGQEVRFVDVRADGVPGELLAEWLSKHGEALINTRSTTWRGMDDATRARAGTDPAGLLAEHPLLMKRPVILRGSESFVGWTKEVQAVFL